MKNITLLLILFISPVVRLQAKSAYQNTDKPKPVITITNATMQRWAGGVVGQRGCNYSIEFTTSPNGKGFLPDTVWIGTQCYPVKIYEGQYSKEEENCKLVKGGDKWTYSFYTNQGEATKPSVPSGAKEEAKPKAPAYKGEAAISYTYKHKRKLQTIASFKQLDPINYP